MSIIESIKKAALLSAIEPDGEAVLRFLFRWYSKTFHTPLQEVEDLPIEYILQHYFECQYEELNQDEKHDMIIHLLETPEERDLREKAEKDDEENFFKEAQAEADAGGVLKKSKAMNRPIVEKALKNIKAMEKLLDDKEIKISFVDEIEDKDTMG